MKVLVLSVGRPERARFGPLFDDYAARVRRLGIELETAFVAETRAGGRFSDAHVRQREARALREALPDRGAVVTLSPQGRSMGSEAFARAFSRWSQPRVAFVLGGPLGLDPALRREAGADVSLSPLTFAHDLARVVLAEQIYRAVTILRGVPYHK